VDDDVIEVAVSRLRSSLGPDTVGREGSVALPDGMIKAGLSCDLSDSFSLVVAANVGICRVPVPARGDRGRDAGTCATACPTATSRSWTDVEMPTRTGVARAAVEGHLDRLAGPGIDLVIVSNTALECPRCRPSEGKVLARAVAPADNARTSLSMPPATATG
jgi:hypothetical protein